ncbi:hypothetical protein [Methanomethylophilus alvi]|uniref:hypothetical protein n=1 Tax=Methanomethylophilus alvi TaxID=1291540 RepID=UPI0037DC2B6F
MDARNKDKLTALVATGVVFVLVLLTAIATGNGSVSIGDTEIRFIKTDSMDGGDTGYEIGSVPENSLVTITPVGDISEVEVGDVVAYSLSGYTIIHRVVSIDDERNTVYTKGDTNYAAEEISADQVYGKVTWVSTTLGFFVGLAKDRLVMAGAMCLCVIVIALSMADIVRARKAEGGGGNNCSRGLRGMTAGDPPI